MVGVANDEAKRAEVERLADAAQAKLDEAAKIARAIDEERAERRHAELKKWVQEQARSPIEKESTRERPRESSQTIDR